MPDEVKKKRQFWLWTNQNKALLAFNELFAFPNPNGDHIRLIEYSAYAEALAEADRFAKKHTEVYRENLELIVEIEKLKTLLRNIQDYDE